MTSDDDFNLCINFQFIFYLFMEIFYLILIVTAMQTFMSFAFKTQATCECKGSCKERAEKAP